MQPFSEVAVDLIGPWKIKVRGRLYEFNALTCIDTVTNLVELAQINRKPLAKYLDDLLRVGLRDTHGWRDASTIMGENSQDGNSKSYSKI